MNACKLTVVTLAVFAGIAATADADANGRRHHHHRGHVGFYFGAPFFPYYAAPYYPRYYYPPAYYPPTVVPAPVSPPVYIEQSSPAPSAPVPLAQSAPAYWYYCADSQTYYPYVQRCATPWQQVIPQPSAPPS
jgi:hypothetical protein